MSALLVARDVTVRYQRHTTPAVIAANLQLQAGEAVGIVGESGSGKTTFARALVGAREPSEGEVTISGRRWNEIPRRDPLRRTVQMVFQDPYASLNPILSARQAVAEVFRVWDKVPNHEAVRRAEALLKEVGLVGSAVDARPAHLSGGQRQRVGIARALACNPAVLVADEPTSALDVSVQAQILNLLADLRDRRHLALVLVSHDLSVVRHMTERTMVMYGGRVVERGSTAALFSTPRHPYTRVLLDSVPERSGRARLGVNNDIPNDHAGCVFARRCAFVDIACLTEQPNFTGGEDDQVSCIHPAASQAQLKQRGGS